MSDYENAYLRREMTRLAEMIGEIAGMLGRGEAGMQHGMDRLEEISAMAQRTAQRLEDGYGKP